MSLVLPFAPKAGSADKTIFDHVIVGGGPVGLFTAYELLHESTKAGKPLKLALIAETINSPSLAGTQILQGSDGAHFDGQSREIYDLLLQARLALYETIRRERIPCRQSAGLEIKAPTKDELLAFFNDIFDKTISHHEEAVVNTSRQNIRIPDHLHSLYFENLGQINLPEFQSGLIARIENLGGKIFQGYSYEGQDVSGNIRTLHTNQANIQTRNKPLFVTGAQHLLSLPEFSGIGHAMWTMGLVLGPITPEDRRKISDGPSAFALVGGDIEFGADFPWGGIDEKGYMTFGMGDTPDPSQKSDIESDIMRRLERYFPDIAQKYASTKNVSFGAMLVPKNKKPVVGRLRNYHVMGGWGGRGVVQGYAAARAYSHYIVHGNDRMLRLFETMQPDMPFPSNNDDPVNGLEISA